MVLCHFVLVSLCFISKKKIKPFEGLLNWICVDTSFVDKQFHGFLPMKRVHNSQCIYGPHAVSLPIIIHALNQNEKSLIWIR